MSRRSGPCCPRLQGSRLSRLDKGAAVLPGLVGWLTLVKAIGEHDERRECSVGGRAAGHKSGGMRVATLVCLVDDSRPEGKPYGMGNAHNLE